MIYVHPDSQKCFKAIPMWKTSTQEPLGYFIAEVSGKGLIENIREDESYPDEDLAKLAIETMYPGGKYENPNTRRAEGS